MNTKKCNSKMDMRKRKWRVRKGRRFLMLLYVTVSEKTLEGLINLQEQVQQIAIASGRPTHGVKEIARILRFKEYGGYLLNFNGARVTNAKTGEVAYQQLFPKEYLGELYQYAIEHNMGLVTYKGNKVITGTRVDEHMKYKAWLNHMEIEEVENFVEYVDFDINKCLFTAPKDIAAEYEKELAERYKGVLSIYRSEPYFIECMPLGVDKAASIDHLLNLIGMERKNTIACGDGFNDQSMIQYANVGVAMANAQGAVKEVADFVTEKTNDEDGLLEVIEKFF